MAQCHWCDKSLPGSDIPACGSCFLRSPPRVSDSVEKSEGENAGYDLSYLNKDESKPQKKGKSVYHMQADLNKLKHQQATPLQEVKMRELRLKSNSLRNRSMLMGSLVLHFDSEGVASFPEAQLAQVREHMSLRPNRFQIIEEEKPDLEDKLIQARIALEYHLSALVSQELSDFGFDDTPSSNESGPQVESPPKPTSSRPKKATKKKSTKKKSTRKTVKSS